MLKFIRVNPWPPSFYFYVHLFPGNLIQMICFKYHLYAETHKCIFLAWTSFPIWKSNYLVDIASWLSNRDLKLNMYQNEPGIFICQKYINHSSSHPCEKNLELVLVHLPPAPPSQPTFNLSGNPVVSNFKVYPESNHCSTSPLLSSFPEVAPPHIWIVVIASQMVSLFPCLLFFFFHVCYLTIDCQHSCQL